MISVAPNVVNVANFAPKPSIAKYISHVCKWSTRKPMRAETIWNFSWEAIV